MGLSIFYSAELRNRQDLYQMTSEVEDICRSMDWPFQIVDAKEEMSAELMDHLGLSPDQDYLSYNGIIFKPDPESEWVHLTFLENRLVPVINLQFVDLLVSKDDFYTAFTKLSLPDLLYMPPSSN